MRRLAALALALAACCTAHAQPPPPSLVGGIWIHNETYPDPTRPGAMGRVSMLAHFDPDGRLTVRRAQVWQGGGSQAEGYYSYRLTGPASYRAVLNDYAPKQDCSSGIACVQFPAVFGQPGASAECQFEFQNAFIVIIACGGGDAWRWTRQPEG